jgi:hypothetical protein
LVVKHEPSFKPSTYHDIREKYLKQEVDQTMNLLEEYKLEWKKKKNRLFNNVWWMDR